MKNTLFFFIYFCFCIFTHPAYPATIDEQSIQTKRPTDNVSESKHFDNATVTIPNDNSPIASEKELVVVSKTPEFFSYILSGISALLIAITVLMGLITGIGFLFILSARKEKKQLETLRITLEKEQEKISNSFESAYKDAVQKIHNLSIRLQNFNHVKRELETMLSSYKLNGASTKHDIFMVTQKTIMYSDIECLRLYSEILLLFGNDADMVRLVRNGILQFTKNYDPKVST